LLPDRDPACITAHHDRFGTGPDASARAPGRVNLIGEHIDYSAGVVLPMSIDRFAWACASVSDEPGIIRAHACDLRSDRTAHLDQYMATTPTKGDWANYTLGTIAAIRDLLPNGWLDEHGINLSIRCEVPMGAGLSSSAAIEVATARCITAMLGLHVDPLELAKRCQQGEHRFAGVPCGLMDQAACSLAPPGKLVAFDCQNESAQIIPRPDGVRIVVIDSGIRHTLSHSAYSEIRGYALEAARLLGVNSLRVLHEAQGENVDQRSLPQKELAACSHALGEMRRVREAIGCLIQGDIAGLGRLLNQSHASLRDTLHVSCPEVDTIIEIAQRTPGVFGARMTGAGFGGCTLLLCEAHLAQQIADSVLMKCPPDVDASLVLIDSGL
jgi:galactokinase